MQDFKKARLADIDGLIVNDSELYPNRLICVVRLKIFIEGEPPVGNWGTGSFITDRYVLTAAHVIINLLQRSQINQDYRLEGYVRQALNDGKCIGTYRIKPESIRISKHF